MTDPGTAGLGSTPGETAAGAGLRRSPTRAAFLSFLWPGLGQLYAGRRGLALVLGVPVLVIAGFFVVQAIGGIAVLGSRMFVPAFAWSVLALAVVVGVWRLAAIIQAFSSVGTATSRRQPIARGVLAVLLLLVVGTHALIGYYSWAFVDASNRIFVGNAAPTPTPGPGQTPNPSAVPSGAGFGTGSAINPPTTSSRVTILLTGIDAYRTRTEALNDTLLVVSYDPVAGTAALLSVPRDTSDFKLYFGGVFQGKINSLMTWAYAHPKSHPDNPVDTLTKEVGYLLGIPVNFYAAINLLNFEKMIDLVGGVDVNNPKVINGPLTPGCRRQRLHAGSPPAGGPGLVGQEDGLAGRHCPAPGAAQRGRECDHDGSTGRSGAGDGPARQRLQPKEHHQDRPGAAIQLPSPLNDHRWGLDESPADEQDRGVVGQIVRLRQRLLPPTACEALAVALALAVGPPAKARPRRRQGGRRAFAPVRSPAASRSALEDVMHRR
jgi:polyisoprenyl-teichoic acid--peptidoglycan teichoic acid transferase